MVIGSKRAEQFKQVTDTVSGAVKSAGGIVVAALALAAAALLIAAAALVVALKVRPARG